MPLISRDHVPFIFERLLQIERLMTKVCFKIDLLLKIQRSMIYLKASTRNILKAHQKLHIF
jgi:hypothetical protein